MLSPTKIPAAALFAFVVLFVGCKERDQHSSTANESTVRPDNDPKEDSLSNQDHYHYLSNLATKKVGELILNDSIRPADNEITLRCIDSLKCKSLADRFFYFSVFTKILKKADGALGETVAEKSLAFVQTDPKEFSKNIQQRTEQDLIAWASSIASELIIEYEDSARHAAGRSMQKIIDDCTACDGEDRKTLTRLKKAVTERSVN